MEKYKFFCGILQSDVRDVNDFATTLAQGQATQAVALLIASFCTARDNVSIRRAVMPLVAKMTAAGISGESLPPALREKLASARKWRKG